MTAQLELPCANCGGTLKYDPGTATLACPFCGAENDLPPPPEDAPARIEELDYRAALGDRLDEAQMEEAEALPCPSCGAEIKLDDQTLADDCPFCAAPLAKDAGHSMRYPKPQAVLPFSIEERDAKARMKDWLGSLWFAPSGLSKYAEAGRPISGVYLPYYTYDAEGSADYSGARGDAYYVTRTRTVMVDGKPQTQTYRERRIRWTPVSGHVRRFFDDVLVPASETLGPLGKGAEEGERRWDLAGLNPYRQEYLAGFRAETPSVELATGFDAAQGLMAARLRRDARFEIGGDEQRINRFDDRYEQITFKHVLLPVWLAAYRYRNEPYRVVINGRTGEISGQRPYSWWKIGFAVAIGLAIAVGIGYAIAQAQ